MIPQVDILLATYNGKLYIRELLQSLLNQTYPHFRILISDGGSKDGTLKVIQEIALQHSRIELLPYAGRLTSNANFSYLLTHAKAPYVMFADQDDVWLPHKIEETLSKMKQLESVTGSHIPCLIHTDLTVVDLNLKKLDWSFWHYCKLFPRQGANLNRLLVQNVVTGCTVMANRALFSVAQPIPPDAIQHDWWFALVAAAFGSIDFIKNSTIFYRQHYGNAIGAKKFSALRYLYQRLTTTKEEEWNSRMRNLAQTKAFINSYSEQLSSKQNEILFNYCELLKTRSFWPNLKKAFKYSFYKHGFARNFIILIPKWTFKRRPSHSSRTSSSSPLVHK